MGRRSRKRKLPEPYEVEIESLSHEGRGIAHHNDKTVFVSAALPGEKVTVKVDKSNKKFEEARVVEVHQASEQRIEPKCEYFGLCGGCSMQHINNEDQLQLKQTSVFDMMRHAGLDGFEEIPALIGPAWHYRQKARLGVKYVIKKQKLLVGFREKNSPYLTDMDFCHVLHEKVAQHILPLKQLIEEMDAKQSIAQIEVAADDDNVTLVFRHLEMLSDVDTQKLTDFAKQTGFYVQRQPQGPDSILNVYPLEQSLWLRPEEGIEIEFKATDFTQVNADMNRAMVQQALRYLNPQPEDTILDLFCGLGNFSLPLARRGLYIVGVEGSEVMAQRASDNAKALSLSNTEFHAADLTKEFKGAAWTNHNFDKILLDPPRTGALELVQQIELFDVDEIVYISCQPTTLVRDAAVLKEKGYRLTHLGVMDMFPQTAHVESMAVFKR